MSASNTRLSATTTMPSADVCFFFQAEDGIRDVAVTGVQTCALPISEGRDVPHGRVCDRAAAGGGGGAATGQLNAEFGMRMGNGRSGVDARYCGSTQALTFRIPHSALRILYPVIPHPSNTVRHRDPAPAA